MKHRLIAIVLAWSLILALGGCQQEPSQSSSDQESSSSSQSSSSSSSQSSSQEEGEESSSSQSSQAVSTPDHLSRPASAPASTSSQSVAQGGPPTGGSSQGTDLFDSSPAVKSWTAAYDTFYAGSESFQGNNVFIDGDDCQLRPGFIFPIYSPKGDTDRYNMGLFVDNMTQRDTLEKFIVQDTAMYGTLLDKAGTSDFYGEGLIGQDYQGRWILGKRTERQLGVYYPRWSMTITAGVENQLTAMGFDNETTQARALWIYNLATGTLFMDGENLAFLAQINQAVEPEQQLVPGKVYSMAEVQEILREHFDCLYPDPNTQESDGEKANPDTAKPVIYLYPQQPTQVTVQLDYQGEFTYTYPTYEDGWRVTAYPDGRLVNQADGSEHYYLFWEGNKKVDWDFSEGFVVPGDQVESFLRETLSQMGLTPREYNDFLVYWVPELQRNQYNLITFATDQYEQLAPLTITPAPDSVLRVHMVYKAISQPIQIPPQTFTPFVREGFTVVEWGGTRA